MKRNLTFRASILILGFASLVSQVCEADWSEDELVGTHIFEGANGFALFSRTHLMWILNGTPGDTAGGMLATLGEAVGGTYQHKSEHRLSLDISHAMDPEMIGQHWEYEIQWLDKDRVQFWVLNPDGSRSPRTGVAKMIN